MPDFRSRIGHKFQDNQYLRMALTHSSYANEIKKGMQSNERLEFLGDSILSVVVSDFLYHQFPDKPEGELTKLRAVLVCEKSLCQFARSIQLGDELRLGKGESQNGGRERPSILADTFEALIAAIYLDAGMDAARRFILRFIKSELGDQHTSPFRDYKTMLQEVIQQNPEERLKYVLVDESGPDHDKRFAVEVHLNSNRIASGVGKSKKDAEQQAAREALRLMGYDS